MKIPCPLSYETQCNLCHEVEILHEKVGDGYEYGLNWYEFINTNQTDIYPLLRTWWEALSKEAQLTYIKAKIKKASDEVEYWSQFI